MLGREPWIGRRFDDPGAPDGAMLSYQFWQRRFGGDPDVTGKTLTMTGGGEALAIPIIGVMPPDFRSPQAEIDPPMLWAPLRIDPEMGRGGHWMAAIGRLKQGVTRARAQAEMNVIAASLERLHPQTNTGWRPRLHAIDDIVATAWRWLRRHFGEARRPGRRETGPR